MLLLFDFIGDTKKPNYSRNNFYIAKVKYLFLEAFLSKVYVVTHSKELFNCVD
jgi:hypothetical protein